MWVGGLRDRKQDTLFQLADRLQALLILQVAQSGLRSRNRKLVEENTLLRSEASRLRVSVSHLLKRQENTKPQVAYLQGKVCFQKQVLSLYPLLCV